MLFFTESSSFSITNTLINTNNCFHSLSKNQKFPASKPGEIRVTALSMGLIIDSIAALFSKYKKVV